jgi:hypothetical protein
MAAQSKELPRGIRNNNPGNIDFHENVKWQGLVMNMERTDERFCQFKDPTWGVRAIAVILINYQDKHRINTVRDIVNRWAPSVENNTVGYITAICNATGFGAVEPLDLHRYEALCPLVEAIIRHENGIGPKATPNTWYDRTVIDAGLQRAGVVKPAPVIAAVPVTKETAAATGSAAIGIAQIADVAPQVMQAIDSQQDHLSSGSYVRIAFAVMSIALAATIAYSQVKKHQAGVVA